MNNREPSDSIVRCADLVFVFLAAQKVAEAVEVVKTIKNHAEDIAEDLQE